MRRTSGMFDGHLPDRPERPRVAPAYQVHGTLDGEWVVLEIKTRENASPVTSDLDAAKDMCRALNEASTRRLRFLEASIEP